MNKQLFTLVLAVAALLAGCSKENLASPEGGAVSGEFVSVTLPVQVADAESTPTWAMAKGSSTRSDNASEGFTVSSGDEANTNQSPTTRTIAQALTNVWVLQFNASGANVSTTNVGTLAAGAYLTIPTMQVGTGYTICIVANGVASGLTTSNPATLADFEAKMLHTDAVTDATKLPMVGKLTGVTVMKVGDGKGKVNVPNMDIPIVQLKRIQAEITLTVDFAVPGYTLTGAELYNVPIGAAYGWNATTTTFPDNTAAANFGYASTSAAGMTSLTPTTSGSKTTYKWFIGDNRRGSVAGLTAQSDRNNTKAPAYATFARITIQGAGTIMYDVYLGSGTVTNFDVKRNMTYTTTATIKGSAAFQEALVDTDARVSGKDFPIYIWLTDNKADSPFGISPKSMESTSMMIWGPTTATGATDIYDGKGNTDKIMALSATDYLAAKYCRAQGAEWNLPAQAQLMLMWIYLPAVPVNDHPTLIDYFWSSTESNISKAMNFDFSDGTTNTDGKTYSYYVRCVRDGATPAFGSWKYPKVEGGNTIVSRDAAGGIKSDALLTATQKAFLMNQSTQPIYILTSEYNKVSAKFEVASTDASSGTTWADAYTLCKSYSTGAVAGSWRLPTQRELMLIWMFKSKLTACGSLTTAVNFFWSGTENDSSYAYYIRLGDARSSYNSKTSNYYVRCVRDL